MNFHSNDVRSLKKIVAFLDLSIKVPPEDPAALEVINQGFLIFGENIKSTKDTPRLSAETRAILKRYNLNGVISDCIAIRDSLAHTDRPYRLWAKHAIKITENFYANIQLELTALKAEINLLLRCIESKKFDEQYHSKNDFRAIHEYKQMFDSFEIGPFARKIDLILREAYQNIPSAEEYKNIKTKLYNKIQIHDMRSTINGDYETNKHNLTENQQRIVNEEQRTRKLIGFKILDATRKKKRKPTDERLDDLNDKIKYRKKRDYAKQQLKNFFRGDIDLTEAAYNAHVDVLNPNDGTKAKFIELYKNNITKAAVAQTIPDAYGDLLDISENEKFKENQIWSLLDKFLDSLQLTESDNELLKNMIIATFVEWLFRRKLGKFKNLVNLHSHESRRALEERYSNDAIFQASVKMQLLDIINMSNNASVNIMADLRSSDCNVKSCASSWKHLRNCIAHGNDSIDALTNGASIDAISFTIRLIEEAESVITFRQIAVDDIIQK